MSITAGSFVDFISAVILLFIIMDPLGNIPVFHAMVGGYPPFRRLRIISREMFIAYAVLVLFLHDGDLDAHGWNGGIFGEHIPRSERPRTAPCLALTRLRKDRDGH